MELCDVILRTNRVRCALNMEILDLLNEESVSGARSSRATVYKFDEKSYCQRLKKVSRSLKYDSNYFFDHRHIYIFYTSYSYNSISRYAYRGISAHIPRRDLVIFCVLRSH